MRRHRIAMLLVLGAALACGEGPGPGPSYVLTIAAGDAQTDTIGATLTLRYAVHVTDTAGASVAGLAVSWTVTGGGGTITASSTTNAGGIATATRVLGTTAGTATARAQVAGASVTFTATALPSAAAPVLVKSLPITENYGLHDQFIRDGLAFLSAWNSGVLIYDVGNGIAGGSPANPVLVDSLTTSGGAAHNAWWFHNPVTSETKYLFVGQEGPGQIGVSSSGDIHVVDVSNLTDIREVAFFHRAGAGTHNFWMDEPNQTLYAAYYNGGVAAIDVSGTLSGDISARLIDTLTFGVGNTYTWGVQLYNGSLYATDMLSGLWQLGTSLGTISRAGGGNNETNRYASDLRVANGYAYTGTWDHFQRTGQGGSLLKVWQLSGGGAPVAVDSILVSDVGAVSDVDISADGKLLMFSTESGPSSGFWFYSLADPAHPAFASKYLVSSGVHTATLAMIGGRLYAFGAKNPGGAALIILDVTSLDR